MEGILRRHSKSVATAVSLLIIVACTFYIISPRGEPASLQRLVNLAESDSTSRPVAYVVFQLADCQGRLRGVDVFQWPDAAARIRLAGMLLVGKEKELHQAGELLRSIGIETPVYHVDAAMARALTPLGHTRTPFVVVVSPPRNATLSAALPASVDYFRDFSALLIAFGRTQTS